MANSKKGESRSSRDWLGRRKEEIFQDGEKTGEIRYITDWLGREKGEVYEGGEKKGELRESSDWLGRPTKDICEEGKKVGEIKTTTDWLDRPKDQVFRGLEKTGEQVGTTDWFGRPKKDLYGSGHPGLDSHESGGGSGLGGGGVGAAGSGIWQRICFWLIGMPVLMYGAWLLFLLVGALWQLGHVERRPGHTPTITFDPWPNPSGPPQFRVFVGQRVAPDQPLSPITVLNHRRGSRSMVIIVLQWSNPGLKGQPIKMEITRGGAIVGTGAGTADDDSGGMFYTVEEDFAPGYYVVHASIGSPAFSLTISREASFSVFEQVGGTPPVAQKATGSVDFNVDARNADSGQMTWADGSTTDPVGDATTNARILPPDLETASAVVNTGTLALSVRFAPGTFDASTTTVTVSLDTDESPLSGHPGIDGSGEKDAELIGSEFIISMGSKFYAGRAQVMRYTGPPPNTFVSVGFAPVTLARDGIDVTIPLSVLGGDDGRMRFKVVSSAQISPHAFAGIIDVLPDVGLPSALSVIR